MDIISFNEASTANGRIESFIENPDSASGIVTVPKVIASGETITIPAGRVAVLPNVQVDGVINIEGEVFVPSGSTYGDLDDQIALKANIDSPALTGTPTAPTAPAGDSSTKLATTEFVAKLMDYRGVTAMANVSTAPTLSGAINFSSVSYGSDSFTLTFDEPMDNTDYNVQITHNNIFFDTSDGGVSGVQEKTLTYVKCRVAAVLPYAYRVPFAVVIIGGKNI